MKDKAKTVAIWRQPRVVQIVRMHHQELAGDPGGLILSSVVIRPILKAQSDILLCLRLLGGDPMAGDMPWWKFIANSFLTERENWVFGLNLAEYRAGRREAIESLWLLARYWLRRSGICKQRQFHSLHLSYRYASVAAASGNR